MDDIDRRVLATIDSHGPQSVTALARTLDDHPITIDRHCARLRDRGHLRLQTSSVYVLTDNGKEYLATLPE